MFSVACVCHSDHRGQITPLYRDQSSAPASSPLYKTSGYVQTWISLCKALVPFLMTFKLVNLVSLSRTPHRQHFQTYLLIAYTFCKRAVDIRLKHLLISAHKESYRKVAFLNVFVCQQRGSASPWDHTPSIGPYPKTH